MKVMQLILLATLVAASAPNTHASGTLKFGDWDVSPKGDGWAELTWSSDETLIGLQFDVGQPMLVGCLDHRKALFLMAQSNLVHLQHQGLGLLHHE